MAIKVFTLPDLGEGLTESDIVGWRVAEGDSVALNQVLGEVETAKAVVELPSPFAGVVRKLHGAPGTTVRVGEPIVSFEVAGEAAGDEPAAGRPAAPPAAGYVRPEREANLVGYGAAAETGERPVRRRRTFDGGGPAAGSAEPAASPAAQPVPPAPQAPPAAQAPPAPPAPAPDLGTRPRSTPPVRKLARDLGVDLAQVPGSGSNGLVTRADVEGYTAPRAPSAPPAPAGAEAVPAGRWLAGAAEREARIPIQGVRKATAAAMVASAFTAPQATVFLTVDATASMDLLEKLRADHAFAGLRLTPLVLAAKALCLALERNPALNWRWDTEHGQIVQQNYVNLGIATASERGLTVPNIKDAHTLDLRSLAAALADLVETARAARTTPQQLTGGTISITNVGVLGVDAGTPILNPGEAAILAIGAVRRLPWEYRGTVALRQVLTLGLTFDHRLVDGAQASACLADVGAILADPGMVLTMV
ncbi:2-oxo acid dehydrogenase subunit E2 [Arthrobacter sp. I2-34]|uniref:Dihydrolipoamide acetyltransferase component of pyruvate dehydrogenase complex n=1 Tax=Arthrobacter hankyongi TaxID=2904801 RepID=A0ABS9L152_9MICC|nr:dihydrolipoamide acetyltransferase family protein [Arthrobacter hankyongi]MCG2620400.1 2-oxo acid dehydrogenase subunit E2 [Arthrobacter hankyongi]